MSYALADKQQGCDMLSTIDTVQSMAAVNQDSMKTLRNPACTLSMKKD
jgi:hypothetical protein